MFLQFFYTLRQADLSVSLHEYLTLMEALQQGVIGYQVEDFYALCKTIFIKREGDLDRFDQVFDLYFGSLEQLPDDFFRQQIPEAWLNQLFEKELTEAEKAAIEKLGGLEALMNRLNELLKEQREAHAGGNKWIGVGGTSPFGHGGFHPEGFRIGGESKNRSALKVWQQRDFRDLKDTVELNTRNMKMILKRLRLLSREGLPTELDLDDTIRRTSDNGGFLDLSMQPSRKNRVKILLLMDVGGSMDSHVRMCEELFSAAKWAYKHLEFYYFHNCVYEGVWKENKRRWKERTPTMDLIHKYNSDYKLILVGDAAMSPYELHYKGGSVEHFNEEAGIVWLTRLRNHFKHLVWLNPTPVYEWDFYETIPMIRKFTGDRMFPLTIQGLTQAMRCLMQQNYTYKHTSWE